MLTIQQVASLDKQFPPPSSKLNYLKRQTLTEVYNNTPYSKTYKYQPWIRDVKIGTSFTVLDGTTYLYKDYTLSNLLLIARCALRN